MIYLTALIQGIVEGVTEFLPISSTGHLILTGHLLGFTDDRAKTFEIVIQLAAILAAVWVFKDRFLRLIPTKKNSAAGKFSGMNGVLLLIITTIPAVIVGVLLHDFIKQHLFSPGTVAAALAVGGVFLILFEKFIPKPNTKTIDAINKNQAWWVGVAQAVAVWPGVSRSAATIIGGSFAKLDRKTAVEYSFMAAVPVMCGATALDLYKSLDMLHASDIPLFAVGMISAFITAIIAIKYFLKYIEHHSLAVFGYYRIVLALLVVIFLGK